MDVWGPHVSEAGLHTVGTEPATVPELAAALDPDAPWVLLPRFTPIDGRTWQDAVVPWWPGRAEPIPATVRRMSIDLLLPTAEFLRLAPDLADAGIELLQFRQRPRPDIDYVEVTNAHARAARLRMSELTIGIDLPHAGEVAQLAATSAADLDAAIERFAAV
ncbi:hypothetical protein [Jiangella anatolica]|uniref:Uncharacterized protein n=1 Tax=Jiangella anatolica TaxID=2670374 RepID=A0A2W2B3G4_9ACTN|nr:hypothetical protein [Jiangella anatolica]PZF79480.1 hypothetical protein C1I92_30875 [Jiangella anatolica]